jgi:hypothetical protein
LQLAIKSPYLLGVYCLILPPAGNHLLAGSCDLPPYWLEAVTNQNLPIGWKQILNLSIGWKDKFLHALAWLQEK